MPHHEIDAYLANVEEPRRSTLEALHKTIHEIVPEAEEIISYGIPGFQLHGKKIAGFAAFKNHLTYVPHSGSVLEQATRAAKYRTSKGALQFPVDKPLPKAVVRELIAIRRKQAGV
jgi:uncharacterized protein YdhG (YjbR/CyaY superfamily)